MLRIANIVCLIWDFKLITAFITPPGSGKGDLIN